MKIKIVTVPITRAEAKEIAQEFYKEMVKGVVDVKREILALGGEWHMDANKILLEDGSLQRNIWGFNFFPDDGRLQYTSLINIRPLQNNWTLEVKSKELRRNMERIIRKLIV